MTMFRVMGDHVVSEGEYRALAADARFKAPGKVELNLSGGRTLSLDPAAPPPAPPTAFKPIGRGLPLTIMIRDVFTGAYPKSGLLGGKKDVAVVSGLKNYDVVEASARALNFLAPKVDNHSHLTMPSALSQGTALVAYSPAVVTDSQILSIEFAVDSFPQELFTMVSQAFSSLAGIPLLLPYAGYLMGAAGVVKLAGNLGEALFDGHPPFSISDSIDFDVPGVPAAIADFRILAGKGLAADHYSYKPGKGLVDSNGAVYAGDIPYVVLSLDGAEKPDLAKFAPTAASAAILQRFFSMKDGAEAAVDTIVQGIQLASDLRYRDKALDLKKKIDAAAAGTDTSAMEKDYQAYLKNISNDAMKPQAA